MRTSKAQHERAAGKVKRAKETREEQTKELTNHGEKIKFKDAIMTGDFNEDAH